MSARRRSKSRARGMTLVYLSLALVALMALVSLAVDLGRVRVAKSELCTAVDAAARYAATGLGDGTAVAKAIAAAADNQVDGSALVLTGADVTTGVWSDGTFTAGVSPPNAVRVATGRTQSRGNGIPLLFGQVVGGRTCDVTASAVATIVTRPASYGVIALGKMAQSGGGG